MCCCGIQNRHVITRNSEAETPSGMPGAELSPADKMCNSSAASTLCTGCAGTSPMEGRGWQHMHSLGYPNRPLWENVHVAGTARVVHKAAHRAHCFPF